MPLSDGEQDNLRRGHPRHPLGLRADSPPRSSSSLRLASMHTRPASSSWVHRRSLPSLLTDKARSPSWQKTTSTPAASRESPPPSSSEAPMARKLGKRRTPLEEHSGRMQRLDKQPPVTVGDAWAGGSWLRGAAGKSRSRGSQEAAGVVAAGRRTGAATPSDVEIIRVLDERAGATAAVHPDRGSRGSASSGNLLSNAGPKPLLYVGTGGGFRIRS